MKSIGFAVNETVNCDCCPPYAVLTVYDFLAVHSFMNIDTPTVPAELREWLDGRRPSGCQSYDLTLVAGDASSAAILAGLVALRRAGVRAFRDGSGIAFDREKSRIFAGPSTIRVG